MTDARPFRSAGSGGQRGRPRGPGEYQFAGGRDQLSGPARALIAARRYQQATAAQQPELAPQSRSLLSSGELAALRGTIRSERRFEREQTPLSSSASDV